MDLKSLDNGQLISQLKAAVVEERKISTTVLNLLCEVESRKLYATRGYDSLYSFAVQFLGYSDAAAHRRISAMRAVREIPQIEAKIISGELSLTNIAKAHTFLRAEAKSNKSVSTSEKIELFQSLENKSSRECEKILLTKNPQFIPQEKRRELTETKTEVKVVLNEELIQQLDCLKKLWSHKNPSMTDAELIGEMAKFCLNKVDPLKKESKTPAPGFTSPTSRTRYIPQPIKQEVWKRDQGKCQFKDPITGKLCHSQHLIQYDHIYPWALGGEHTTQNLRLLCSTHNNLRAAQTFQKARNATETTRF